MQYTNRKPWLDLSGSNPVVSHFLNPDHFVQKSIKLLFLLFFPEKQKGVKANSSACASVGKLVHFAVEFTVAGICPNLRVFLAPQSDFPTFLASKQTQKSRKSTLANSGGPFSQTKKRLYHFQLTFNPSCSRLSSLRMTGESEWVLFATGQGQRKPSWLSTRRPWFFASTYLASLFFLECSIVRCVGLLFS